MRQIKFYTDTHIAKAVAIQLRNRGIDIVRCEEVGLAEAKDTEHLNYATTQKRMLITNDDDFLNLISKWRQAGKSHYGVMYCLPHIQGDVAVGKIVHICLEYHALIAGRAGTVEDDIVNQVIYVS